jgi:hypothetical protein
VINIEARMRRLMSRNSLFFTVAPPFEHSSKIG